MADAIKARLDSVGQELARSKALHHEINSRITSTSAEIAAFYKDQAESARRNQLIARAKDQLKASLKMTELHIDDLEVIREQHSVALHQCHIAASNPRSCLHTLPSILARLRQLATDTSNLSSSVKHVTVFSTYEGGWLHVAKIEFVDAEPPANTKRPHDDGPNDKKSAPR